MRINWSEPALADLEAIYDFIARDSSQYAVRFVRRLLDHHGLDPQGRNTDVRPVGSALAPWTGLPAPGGEPNGIIGCCEGGR